MNGFAEGKGIDGLVSVIIPTRDRCGLLREALDSVIAQTYSNWEIVVVDDGSTDGTCDLVREYARQLGESKARLLRQPRRGAQAARNLGARESRGEFIQYLDSDDMLSRDKLASHVRVLTRTALPAAYGGLRLLRGEGGMEAVSLPFGFERGTVSRALRGAHLSPMLMTIRRDALRAAGPWDEELEVLQDVDYAFRLWMSGARAVKCAAGDYIWRRHGGPRVGDAMLDQRRLAARDRVLRNVERGLLDLGLLERMKADLSCSYYLAALTPSDDSAGLRDAWLHRAEELGRPSLPLGGPPLFRVIWAAASASAASEVFQFLFGVKRRLRGLLRG